MSSAYDDILSSIIEASNQSLGDRIKAKLSRFNNTIASPSSTWDDADSTYNGYRVQGIDAPEVFHSNPETRGKVYQQIAALNNIDYNEAKQLVDQQAQAMQIDPDLPNKIQQYHQQHPNDKDFNSREFAYWDITNLGDIATRKALEYGKNNPDSIINNPDKYVTGNTGVYGRKLIKDDAYNKYMLEQGYAVNASDGDDYSYYNTLVRDAKDTKKGLWKDPRAAKIMDTIQQIQYAYKRDNAWRKYGSDSFARGLVSKFVSPFITLADSLADGVDWVLNKAYKLGWEAGGGNPKEAPEIKPINAILNLVFKGHLDPTHEAFKSEEISNNVDEFFGYYDPEFNKTVDKATQLVRKGNYADAFFEVATSKGAWANTLGSVLSFMVTLPEGIAVKLASQLPKTSSILKAQKTINQAVTEYKAGRITDKELTEAYKKANNEMSLWAKSVYSTIKNVGNTAFVVNETNDILDEINKSDKKLSADVSDIAIAFPIAVAEGLVEKITLDKFVTPGHFNKFKEAWTLIPKEYKNIATSKLAKTLYHTLKTGVAGGAESLEEYVQNWMHELGVALGSKKDLYNTYNYMLEHAREIHDESMIQALMAFAPSGGIHIGHTAIKPATGAIKSGIDTLYDNTINKSKPENTGNPENVVEDTSIDKADTANEEISNTQSSINTQASDTIPTTTSSVNNVNTIPTVVKLLKKGDTNEIKNSIDVIKKEATIQGNTEVVDKIANKVIDNAHHFTEKSIRTALGFIQELYKDTPEKAVKYKQILLDNYKLFSSAKHGDKSTVSSLEDTVNTIKNDPSVYGSELDSIVQKKIKALDLYLANTQEVDGDKIKEITRDILNDKNVDYTTKEMLIYTLSKHNNIKDTFDSIINSKLDDEAVNKILSNIAEFRNNGGVNVTQDSIEDVSKNVMYTIKAVKDNPKKHINRLYNLVDKSYNINLEGSALYNLLAKHARGDKLSQKERKLLLSKYNEAKLIEDTFKQLNIKVPATLTNTIKALDTIAKNKNTKEDTNKDIIEPENEQDLIEAQKYYESMDFEERNNLQQDKSNKIANKTRVSSKQTNSTENNNNETTSSNNKPKTVSSSKHETVWNEVPSDYIQRIVNNGITLVKKYANRVVEYVIEPEELNKVNMAIDRAVVELKDKYNKAVQLVKDSINTNFKTLNDIDNTIATNPFTAFLYNIEKDGVKVSDLAASAILASINSIILKFKTTEPHITSLNLFGIEADNDPVMISIGKKLADNGVQISKTKFIEELGDYVLQYMGIKFDKDMKYETAERIKIGAGLVAMQSMEKLGVITIKKITTNDIKQILGNLYNDDFSIRSKYGIFTVGFNKQAADMWYNSDIIQHLNDSVKELNLLNKQYPRTKERKNLDKLYVKGTNIPVNDNKLEAINKLNNVKYVRLEGLSFMLKQSGLDITNKDKLKYQLGYIDEDEILNMDIPANKKITLIGQNQTIESTAEYLIELLQDKYKDGMYFDHFIGKNLRIYKDSNTINPETNKLFRFLVLPEKVGIYIDKKDRKQMNQFKVAIAQAYGYDIDKNSYKDSIRAGTEILNKGYNVLIKEFKKDIKEGKLELEEIGHRLNVLSAIYNYEKTKANKFYSQAVIEVDGLNNGLALKTFWTPMKNNKATNLFLKATGIGSFTTSLNASIGNGLQDAYKLFAKSFISATKNSVAYSKIVEIIGNPIENGDITGKWRKIFKPIVMTLSYGAGVDSLTRNFSNALTESLIDSNPSSNKLQSLLNIDKVTADKLLTDLYGKNIDKGVNAYKQIQELIANNILKADGGFHDYIKNVKKEFSDNYKILGKVLNNIINVFKSNQFIDFKTATVQDVNKLQFSPVLPKLKQMLANNAKEHIIPIFELTADNKGKGISTVTLDHTGKYTMDIKGKTVDLNGITYEVLPIHDYDSSGIAELAKLGGDYFTQIYDALVVNPIHADILANKLNELWYKLGDSKNIFEQTLSRAVYVNKLIDEGKIKGSKIPKPLLKELFDIIKDMKNTRDSLDIKHFGNMVGLTDKALYKTHKKVC